MSKFTGTLIGMKEKAPGGGISDAQHATNMDVIRRLLPGLPRDDVLMIRIVVAGNLTDRLATSGPRIRR